MTTLFVQGRFISDDPIGFAGGDINLYGYVRNQPMMYRDPLGLDPRVGVLANPAIWGPLAAGLAAAGGAIGSAAGAVAASPVAVAAGGLAAGVAIGYYPGQWSANHPSNPVVNGPLNPWTWGTPPFPNQSNRWSRPRPTSQPYCETSPKAIPFEFSPSTPWPVPPPDRDGCAEEIAACVVLCEDAKYDPNMKHIWGGSTTTCLKGCISERCKKGFKF